MRIPFYLQVIALSWALLAAGVSAGAATVALIFDGLRWSTCLLWAISALCAAVIAIYVLHDPGSSLEYVLRGPDYKAR